MARTWVDTLALQLKRAAACFSYGIVEYRHPQRAEPFQAIKTCYRKTHTVTTPLECAEIYQAVKACEKIPGDMAEAGVFLGGSARIMLTASPSQKRMHLFDTFAGLPASEGTFRKGEYAGSIASVKRNLAEFESRLELHPGYFPDSTAGLDDLKFSFVHLDLDLYQGTLAALEWFWPRLSRGGILISHDYPFADGVVRAFSEFFADRPEPVLPLSGGQCLVVKG